jgi:hypothetical protein
MVGPVTRRHATPDSDKRPDREYNVGQILHANRWLGQNVRLGGDI